MIITRHFAPFRQAVRQTFAHVSPGETVFLTSYFHAGDLLSPPMVSCLLHNLQTIASEAERRGYDLAPVTLSRAAALAKQALL